MQAAEVTGTAACPARKHLLLALMHVTEAYNSLCTNQLQTFAKFVPRRFVVGDEMRKVLQKFCKVLPLTALL